MELFQVILVAVLLCISVDARPYLRDVSTFSVPAKYNARYRFNPHREWLKISQKYGVPLPDRHQLTGGIIPVDKSSGPGKGTVPAWNQTNDREYLSPVLVGTPPQLIHLDLDTGSADLWVFSSDTPSRQVAGQKIYRPESSTSSSRVANTTWAISYGDGSFAAGTVYNDIVQLGNVVLPNATIESAGTVSSSLTSDRSMSGLLGLAINHPSTAWPKQPTILQQLGDQLDDNLFSVDLKYQAEGTYDFGYIDRSKYTGNITYHKVDATSHFWKFNLERIHVSSMNTWYIHHWPMVADTGTTLMLLPEELVDMYWSQVPGAHMDEFYDGYLFPCNQSSALPDFEFGFNDGWVGKVPGHYMNFENITKTECYGGIQYGFPDMEFGILGDTWLKSMYVVFDAGNERIGFANKAL